MKKCLSCGKTYDGKEWICDACSFSPEFIDGFPIHASHLLEKNDSYVKDAHDLLDEIEDGYFWFRARKELIAGLFKKYCDNAASYLEIGCGNGTLLREIDQNFKHVSTHGSEIHLNALRNSQKRSPRSTFVQMSIDDIPFINEFDAIGCYDVLEHIEDDSLALRNINNALTPGGTLIITVPQHMFLWSDIDVVSCHQRRYSAKELASKMTDAGFDVKFMSSFVSLLLPAVFLSRRFKSQKETNEFQINPFLNKLFYWICALENQSVLKGLKIPLGVSLAAVATARLPS